ncbi:hypothetical protein WJX81_000944 [Elliptochloris bilobata]|uniref:Zinc finger ZPR1-type domain-containing protein n=1 Tax=Elliptochloris bilobata TaxID=381761 RepID=A0AAW1SHG5_9CHLO
MNCYKNGETRMLLTRIPHFRELTKKREVQIAGAYGERGVRCTPAVVASETQALSRQVVKWTARPRACRSWEIETPLGTQRGSITTVEGLLRDAANALRALQPQHAAADPAQGAAVEAFLARLDACAAGEAGFTLKRPRLQQLHRGWRRRRPSDVAGALQAHPQAGGSDWAAPARGSGSGIKQRRRSSRGYGSQQDRARRRAPWLKDSRRCRGASGCPGEEVLLARYAAPEEVVELPSRCAA